MALEIQKLSEQSIAFFQKLPPKKRLLVALALLGTIGAGLFFAVREPDQRFATLFSGLSPEDAGQVLQELRAQNVPFKVAAGGSAIEVPEVRVHELRIGLASSGIPRGAGVGFEVFDKQTFGTTSFVEKMNYQRALSGELARTIGSIDVVERARVHLALKERSLYKKDEEPPTASVVLKLRPGRELTAQQVKGIVHLVASSVEGLTTDHVTLVDDAGTVLWSQDDLQSTEAQRDIERTLKKRVAEITDSILGPGHSVVVVTAELDTARTERTEELYDKDKVALRSETASEERSGDPAADRSGTGGIAGAQGNLPGAQPPPETKTPLDGVSKGEAGKAATGRMKLSATRNFEVNRIVSRTVGPRLRVSRLHVAVLVDAAWSKSSTTAPAIDVQPVLDRIALLAREAAGVDPARGDRIEVHSVPFASSKDKDLPQAEASRFSIERLLERLLADVSVSVYFAAAGAAALFMLFVAALILRRIRRRRRPEVMPLPPLPLTAREVESHIDAGQSAPLALPQPSAKERAMLAARADSARAARILAAWLTEAADHEGRASEEKP
jgi:flagellar M-ring protein FliF